MTWLRPMSRDPLVVLMILLSATTGLVDAVSVLGLGKVFTANMTGNVVFLGFAAVGVPGFDWTLYVVGLGFFGAAGLAFGLAAVVLGIGTFWLTVWELVHEWRDRVSSAVARASTAPGAPQQSADGPSRRRGPDDGDVIVVHESGR